MKQRSTQFVRSIRMGFCICVILNIYILCREKRNPELSCTIIIFDYDADDNDDDEGT